MYDLNCDGDDEFASRLSTRLCSLEGPLDEADIESIEQVDQSHQQMLDREAADCYSETLEELGLGSDVRHRHEGVLLLSKVCNSLISLISILMRVPFQVTGLAKRVANSDQLRTAFAECCKHADLSPLCLVRPVATRWNTHFECLGRHLLQKKAVERLCTSAAYARYDLDKFTLTDREWKLLEEMKGVLMVCFVLVRILLTFLTCRQCQLFSRITKHVSQASVVLVHQVIPMIDCLNHDLEGIVDRYSTPLAIRHGAKNALKILDKYYSKTDDSEIYRAAMSTSIFVGVLTLYHTNYNVPFSHASATQNRLHARQWLAA